MNTQDIWTNKLTRIKSRFEQAVQDNSTFRNCAGFVAYILGLTNKETMVNTKELVQHLDEVNSINLSDLTEEIYLSNAHQSEVVAIRAEIEEVNNPTELADIINNTRKGTNMLHFAFIDPDNPQLIYERPDIEHKVRHTSWRSLYDNDELGKFKKIQVVFYKASE